MRSACEQKLRCGQSLVEVLVAIAIGVIIMLTIGSIISSSIRTNDVARKVQVGAALGRELMENVRVWSEGHWSDMGSIDPALLYYLSTSSSPFVLREGVETLTIGTSTFVRYFQVSSTMRDGSGYINAAGTVPDPSTRELTVFYTWPGNAATRTMATYLTRNVSRIFTQTDWSGGPTNDTTTVTSGTPTTFTTSSRIDYTTSTGSLYMQLP